MAYTLATYLVSVKALLVDTANTELSDVDLDGRIKAAVERYSHDAPDEVTADVTGDGGNYYAIASNLTSWVEGFSDILSIEYPAATVASDETPVYLEAEDWRANYFDGSTRYLYLPNHAPAATETMRITYTAPYTFGASGVDTPAQDFYAICHLAAGLACQTIAAKYSRTSDSTITADSVAHTSRAGEFARRAREYIELYNEHMGLTTADGAGGVAPAGAFVDFDTAPTWPLGTGFLFHGKETR